MLHHYTMVHEQKFDFVISFTGTEKKRPLQVGKTYHINDVTLKVDSRTELQERMSRSEVSLFNTTAPGAQYMHRTVFFELNEATMEDITASKDTEQLVKAICLIRNELKLEKSSLKILVHDTKAGVSGGAVFLSLYQMLQTVDKSFSDDNNMKRTTTDIDVFDIVNNLRKDRAFMIPNFATYKLLFLSLKYYGEYRVGLKQLQSKNAATKSRSKPFHDTQMIKVTRKPKGAHNDSHNSTDTDQIEYVLYEESGDGSLHPFDEYYEEDLDPFDEYDEEDDDANPPLQFDNMSSSTGMKNQIELGDECASNIIGDGVEYVIHEHPEYENDPFHQ